MKYLTEEKNEISRGEFYDKFVFEKDRKYFSEFFNAMVAKIKSRNLEKGDGWKHCDLRDLKERLRHEFKEWQAESVYNSKNVSTELIDIANQAMLLWIRINLVIE